MMWIEFFNWEVEIILFFFVVSLVSIVKFVNIYVYMIIVVENSEILEVIILVYMNFVEKIIRMC